MQASFNTEYGQVGILAQVTAIFISVTVTAAILCVHMRTHLCECVFMTHVLFFEQDSEHSISSLIQIQYTDAILDIRFFTVLVSNFLLDPYYPAHVFCVHRHGPSFFFAAYLVLS